MTLDELHQFDGIKNPKVYIGCKNKVFDVTNSCKNNNKMAFLKI